MTEAALFYEAAHATLGDDFLDDIRYAVNSIRERPKLGAEIAHGFRRMLVRRFPFSIIYFIEPGQIVVVAVAHQSRSPDYWKVRI
jgi:plasmid stabilization system protein ParE